ncbi:hypothetical protein AB0H83_51920, partial [Dactylosporangium sp. NPDC050688]
GFASPYEASRLLGKKAVLRKAATIRPSTAGRARVSPTEVGYHLGRDYRTLQDLYTSVEDSMVVVGPPRQGKDALFCVPFTIDAPGPVIVTSARIDIFLNTYAMRAQKGNVYVFDPNGMTQWPERMRYSPIRGCESGMSAASRALAMLNATGAPVTFGTTATPDTTAAFIILRGYLHAAALERRTLTDIIRWANEQVNPEPIEILQRQYAAGRAAPGWAEALTSVTVNGDPHTRGLAFAHLTVVFDCFNDPTVLRECSPHPDDIFDIKAFLSGPNTLYILGREGKSGGIAPVITAMVEDLLIVARSTANMSPNGRLDPPLTVELNDAAHISPTPKLPMYMGDSGAFSISIHAYFQSLSQARLRWGA